MQTLKEIGSTKGAQALAQNLHVKENWVFQLRYDRTADNKYVRGEWRALERVPNLSLAQTLGENDPRMNKLYKSKKLKLSVVA